MLMPDLQQTLQSKMDEMCQFLVCAIKTNTPNLPNLEFSSGPTYFSEKIKKRAFFDPYKNYIGLVVTNYTHSLEYPQFANDPIIGSIAGETFPCLVKLMSHEIAHWYCEKAITVVMLDSHNFIWQEIYRSLRKKFVNNLPGINQIGFETA